MSLHLEYSKEETRRVVITTTLIIVLFTTIVFGGSTLPLLKFLQAGKKTRRAADGRTSRNRPGRSGRRKEKLISLSKTREFGQAIDSELLSELTEEEEVNFADSKLGGFARLDRKYFTPFFTRRFTNQVSCDIYLTQSVRLTIIFLQELRDCKSQMAELQSKWYEAIRVDNQTDDEDEAPETASQKTQRTNSTISMTSSHANIIS